MEILPQNKKTLEPRKVINVDGKVGYSESSQSWNIIQLKKELFNEFPELKERRGKFSYKIVLSRDYDSFKDIVNGVKDDKVMPVLMWIYRDK